MKSNKDEKEDTSTIFNDEYDYEEEEEEWDEEEEEEGDEEEEEEEEEEKNNEDEKNGKNGKEKGDYDTKIKIAFVAIESYSNKIMNKYSNIIKKDEDLEKKLKKLKTLISTSAS